MLLMGAGGAKIKSVQSGTASFASGTLVQTIAISEVDPANTIVLATGVIGGTGDISPASVLFAGYISDPSTLTLERQGYSASVVTAVWQVIEFEDVAIQYVTGYINVDRDSATVSISEVNPSRTFVVLTYTSTLTSSSGGARSLLAQVPWAMITDPTTLTVRRMSSGSDRTYFHAYLVEVK